MLIDGPKWERRHAEHPLVFGLILGALFAVAGFLVSGFDGGVAFMGGGAMFVFGVLTSLIARRTQRRSGTG